MKCDVCNGTGVVEVLLNSSDFHYEMAYPEYEEQECEYCENGECEDE